jgi:methionyl-tRNA formyltransferase
MARLAPPPARPSRLVYLGTPALAVPPLRALVAAGFDVARVVTRPDRRRGRGGRSRPSPVKAAAEELGLDVTSQVDDVLGIGAELGVVVAFGQIIRPHVLAELPMVNLHFSLLPRWRGAAPVERALLAGDDTTGVCLMAVEEGLDTGGVYARAETPIGATDTLETLRDRLVGLGTGLLVDGLTAGLSPPAPQRGEETYATKLTPEDRRLDWAEPADHLDRVVRLGGAWTTFRGARFRVWSATPRPDLPSPSPGHLDPSSLAVGTGTHPLVLEEVQPEGRARQDAAAWRNGAHLGADDRLGDAPADLA